MVEKKKIDDFLIKILGDEGNGEVASGKYNSFADLLVFEFENDTNISNGDTVKLKISLCDKLIERGTTLEEYKEYLGIDFENKYSLTILALPEYQEVDIYGMVKDYIKYKGGNGNAYADFEFPKDYQHVIGNKIYLKFSSSKINFIVDNQSIGEIHLDLEAKNHEHIYGPLSNGDIVYIKLNDYYLSNINDVLHKYKYTIDRLTYSYKVEGLGEYISSREMFTEKVADMFWKRLQNNFGSLSESYHFTPLNMYLLTLKPGVEMEYGEHSVCKIYVVYKQFKEKTWLSGEETCYRYATVSNLIINPDGSVKYDFDSNWYDGTYSTAKNAIKNFESEGYTVEKIK